MQACSPCDTVLLADEIYVGSGSLTHTEEQTVFALWAIMTGPLLVGIDFRKVPAASATILL
jgi:hypothetical protein